MANRSLGTLTLDLIARVGGFSRGMDAAERKADQTARSIARKQAQRAKEIEKIWSGIGVAIGVAFTGAIAAVAAIDQMVKGVASFKDLEETTGATAEGIASIAVAAGTAGVSMEEVAANSIRLTKSLVGVDDESKAAGAAIKALGLDLESFKQLDPVGQTDALTKAFSGFADGAEKTAVATALWGKQGAEMLKLLKALEEQGGRTTILTQQQIEQADAYADAQAKASTELKLYAQAAATQAAPAFLALTNAATDFIKELAGIGKEAGALAQSTAIKTFADNAVKSIAFVIDAADGVSRVVTLVGKSLGALAAAAVSVATGEFRQAGRIIDEFLAEREAILQRGFFSDSLAARLGAPGPAPRGQDTRPRLDFRGAEKIAKDAKSAKKEIDEVANAINELEKELALFGQDESFRRALELEGLGATNAQLEAYRANLAKLEELKASAAIQETIDALVKEREELGLTNEQLTIHKLVLQGASAEQIAYAQSVLNATKAAREQQEALDEGKRIFEETRTPAEQYAKQLERLNELLQKGAIDNNTYMRAIFQAQDKFDEQTKKTTETVDTFAKKFAENAQDFLGQGLYDAMTGNFKNIGDAFAQMITRMVAEAASAELSRHLFGDLLKGGQGQGIFGSILSGLGSLFGGSSIPSYDVGTDYVPRTGFALVHQGEQIIPASENTGLRGDNYNFSIAVNSNGYMDRAAEERAAARIARSVGERQKRRSA